MAPVRGFNPQWGRACPLLLLALSGCLLPPRSAYPPEPAPAPDATFAAENASGESLANTVADLARELAAEGMRHQVVELDRRSLTHRRLWNTLGPLVDSAAGMGRDEIGRSVQGRPLYAISYGRGPVRVLLWSQMHGNEPTATLALADLFRYIAENPRDPLVQRLGEQLTVIAVPMLNPDGAERNRRENAAGIDLNRDARNQVSPEARALAALHASSSPQFGFNLHDQGRRVGESGQVVAISLLAPPHDPQGSYNETRTRARQLAAVMRIAAEALAEGRVTRYDETYNPHAFGDAMQSWGTSTVLLETGVWENDSGNEYLRQVNFALLLTALDAIATGSYARAELHEYESLPSNRVPSRRR